MSEPNPPLHSGHLESQVALARAGEREALEAVIKSIQKDVYGLALRFLWHPQDAEDASQEILIRVITGLANFHGASSFRTWVYRVASNTLLTLRKQRMEKQAMRFEDFAEDLASGLENNPPQNVDNDSVLLLEEVKIGCTTAMLLCLEREQRLAYILGEILDLDQRQGSEILEISATLYRKRLSRARSRISSFMLGHCGLVDSENPCRCSKRVGPAIRQGRIDPHHKLFAASRQQASRFPKVLAGIRQLEETRRAAALFRSHPQAEMSEPFNQWLRQALRHKTLEADIMAGSE